MSVTFISPYFIEPITETLNVIVENEINNEMTNQNIKLPNTRFQNSKKKIINIIYDLRLKKLLNKKC